MSLKSKDNQIHTARSYVPARRNDAPRNAGAVGGYPEKEDKCDASLSKPGPFNDVAFRGSVANVHQIPFIPSVLPKRRSVA